MKKLISSLLLCASISVTAQPVTLFCSGKAEASNSSKQSISSQVSTSIEFNEVGNYLSINDTASLQRFSIYPYKEIHFFDSSIIWKTSLDESFAKGTFSGRIDRKTGEMITSYFAIVNTGVLVFIDGKLFCELRKSNKF